MTRPKLRIGDKILVEMTVIMVDDRDRIQPTTVVFNPSGPHGKRNTTYVFNDCCDIRGYTPAPWECKTGDRVKYHVAHSEHTVPETGTVLSLHDERAWVMFDNHAVPLSPLISHIRKAD